MKRIDRAKLRYRLMTTHWCRGGIDDPQKLKWEIRLSRNRRMRLKQRAWGLYSQASKQTADTLNGLRLLKIMWGVQ